MSAATTCGWLVEREREITDEMVDAGWYPDSEADLWEVVECGAPVHDITDGWECDAGHHHYEYGSPSQIAEEHREAMAEQYGEEW